MKYFSQLLFSPILPHSQNSRIIWDFSVKSGNPKSLMKSTSKTLQRWIISIKISEFLFRLWGKRVEEAAAGICQNSFMFSNLNKSWVVTQFCFFIYRE